jgi:hypothetical protein
MGGSGRMGRWWFMAGIVPESGVVALQYLIQGTILCNISISV